MRICVLVIASHNKPEYLQMEAVWKSRLLDHSQGYGLCDVWLLHSKPANQWIGDLVNDSFLDPDNVELDIAERTIYIKQDECLIPGVLAKTVKALEFLSKYKKYDFVWRTNLSSVLDFDGLVRYVQLLDPIGRTEGSLKGFYGGYIGVYHNNIIIKENYQFSRFASGAGFLMSANVVDWLLLNQSLLRWDIIDDVALGLLLEPVFGLVHIERQWLKSLDEPVDRNVFHYRCESYMHLNTVDLMLKVLRELSNSLREY